MSDIDPVSAALGELKAGQKGIQGQISGLRGEVGGLRIDMQKIFTDGCPTAIRNIGRIEDLEQAKKNYDQVPSVFNRKIAGALVGLIVALTVIFQVLAQVIKALILKS